MGRSCVELLEPDRYAGAPNFVLATYRLGLPDENPTDTIVQGCALLDLSGTREAAAAVAVQAAGLMEGRTSCRFLPTITALDDASQAARDAGASTFDCVVGLPGTGLGSLSAARGERLPGAWIAVTE